MTEKEVKNVERALDQAFGDNLHDLDNLEGLFDRHAKEKIPLCQTE